MSWRQISLGEAIRVKHGYAFKGEFFAAKGSHLVVTPGNFHEAGGLRVREGKERFYTSDIPESFVLAKGDLIVAMTEQGEGLLGSSAWIPEDNFFLHNQRIGLISHCDEDLLHKRYLYWLFNTPNVRRQIRASATGAKVKHTAPERIYKVLVSVPSAVEQQKIAALLDSFEENETVFKKQISQLEEAARLIYTEWFVRSKPRQQMKWRSLTLGDIADIEMGQSPDSDYFNEDGDGFPFHQGVSDFGDRFVAHRIYTTQATRFAQLGDILCSVRAPVGRLNITRERIAIGRGLSAMRSKLGTQSLLYYQLKHLFFKEDLIGGGAIFASVGKKELLSQEVTQPDRETALEFDRIASDLDAQIENLTQQVEKLRQARDLLLPRLISGQLRL